MHKHSVSQHYAAALKHMLICLQATAQLDLKRKELTAHLQKMGVGLGGLGKTLVTRTTDLFDQVRSASKQKLHVLVHVACQFNAVSPRLMHLRLNK